MENLYFVRDLRARIGQYQKQMAGKPKLKRKAHFGAIIHHGEPANEVDGSIKFPN